MACAAPSDTNRPRSNSRSRSCWRVRARWSTAASGGSGSGHGRTRPAGIRWMNGRVESVSWMVLSGKKCRSFGAAEVRSGSKLHRPRDRHHRRPGQLPFVNVIEAADRRGVVTVARVPPALGVGVRVQADHAERPAGGGEEEPAGVGEIDPRVDILHRPPRLSTQGRQRQSPDQSGRASPWQPERTDGWRCARRLQKRMVAGVHAGLHRSPPFADGRRSFRARC